MEMTTSAWKIGFTGASFAMLPPNFSAANATHVVPMPPNNVMRTARLSRMMPSTRQNLLPMTALSKDPPS